MRLVLPFFAILTLTAACRSGETSSGGTSSGPHGTTTATHTGGAATGGSGGTGGSATGGTGGTATGGTGGVGGTGGAATGGGGSTSTGGSGGTGTGGSGGSTCTGTSSPAQIVTPGQAGQLLLRGMVVTPGTAFAGEVLVVGDTITCAAPSCATFPEAATATIVDTQGILFPGLIDTHNHILFDIFDETDWSPTQSYSNHNQWTNEARYGAMVDAKQYLNGEGSAVDFGCEMDKYGELKGLVAGTTAIVGAANPANRACYGSLARTVDQTPSGLGSDKVQVATLFPTASAADGVCSNFTTGKTDAYVIHVAEGIDASALAEFGKLGTVTTTDGCLYASKTTIVHGAALGDPELTTMAANGMSLVWSPRSNVFLYGAGTDYTKTANIPLALSKGINVALAPDWSIGGSQNLLDELRFAHLVDSSSWGNQITPQMLVRMVTTNAANALGLGTVLGQLAPGFKADLMVIGGDPAAPYDALLAATPADVRLVLVGGKALYGDKQLQPLGPATPGCEDLAVCCQAKFACVAAPGTATDKLGQTFSQISATLSQALVDYDALNLTPNKFAPITPLVRCP